MTTARDFIYLALKEAGVLGVGQDPLAEDINDAFTLLSRMLAQWQKKRWLVPNLIDVSAIGNNQKSNLIGPNQYYNTPRPDKIQAAYFIQLAGGNASNNVSFQLAPVWSYEDYSNLALKELNSWPQYFFYDGAYPNGNVYIWPIPSNQYEIHLIVKGSLLFSTPEIGIINDIGLISGGAGYVDGIYNNVDLITVTGTGTGAKAQLTVVGGIIVQTFITDFGDGYAVGDTLTQATVPGGLGYLLSVNGISPTGTGNEFTLDSVFEMPPEYEEAIHYNLAVRLRSMYQLQPDLMQNRLAANALRTIRQANVQIPSLKMPGSLRFNKGNGNGFYIFNADAR